MANPKIKDVVSFLEAWAPPSLQESYDNAGLLVGDREKNVTGILVALDCTEAVVEEARRTGCNLIVAHHPIIFKGLKRLTGANHVERTVISAIRNEIALFAAHTNLDNVFTGVNQKIASVIGLKETHILIPRKDTLSKLVTFIPHSHAGQVMDALFKAGAGQIGNYKNCSFRLDGQGTYLPSEGSHPFKGEPGKMETVDETRAEVIFPRHLTSAIMNALRATHPYEEVAHYLTELSNEDQESGTGMIGLLPEPLEPFEFLRRLKASMALNVIRHTAPAGQIHKVAVCGGSGSSFLRAAILAGADAYVSADFKYHEFFDADGKILIADVGHFESEQFTKDLLVEVLSKKFPTFAINFSKTVTNPISYL